MAVITGYSTLLTEVGSWLARSDLSAAIPGFVQNFEERFYRQPKNFGKWMESSLSVAISTTAAVPSDFLALRVAYLNGQTNANLISTSLEQMLIQYPRAGTAGQPKWIARNAETFIFGPVPSSGYTLNGTYYAKPTLLRSFASDAAAHWLILNAPDLLLYGSLMEAQPYVMNDKRYPLWDAKYKEALQDYRDLIRTQNNSGGSMQTLVA
jgi:hypothetical protein